MPHAAVPGQLVPTIGAHIAWSGSQQLTVPGGAAGHAFWHSMSAVHVLPHG
jgi:hypothetical protein